MGNKTSKNRAKTRSNEEKTFPNQESREKKLKQGEA